VKTERNDPIGRIIIIIELIIVFFDEQGMTDENPVNHADTRIAKDRNQAA